MPAETRDAFCLLETKFEYIKRCGCDARFDTYFNRGQEGKMKFCWTTINVKDMGKSLAFYQEAAGLSVAKRMNPNPDMEIAFIGEGETQIELIRDAKNQFSGYGKDISLGFVVDSVEAHMEYLKSKGISIIAGPFQPNPTIKFFYVLDPNGLRIQFVENIPR